MYTDNILTNAQIRLDELVEQFQSEAHELDDHQKLFILDEVLEILNDHPELELKAKITV